MKREPPRPPQAILFDLYATLITYIRPGEYQQTNADIAHLLGVEPEDYQRAWGGRFLPRNLGKEPSTAECIRVAAQDLGLEPSTDQLEQAAARRLGYTRELFDRNAATLPVLHALKALGIPLALVSDCSPEVAELWDSHPLFRPFSVRSLSCELGAMKPEPMRYHHALNELKVHAEHCWYVGDGGSREFSGAHAVGLFAIQYRYPGLRERVYDEDTEPADLELTEFGHLLELIRP